MSMKTPWLEVGPIHIVLCVAEHEHLSARRVPLVPEEAREIARALLDAADKLETDQLRLADDYDRARLAWAKRGVR